MIKRNNSNNINNYNQSDVINIIKNRFKYNKWINSF